MRAVFVIPLVLFSAGMGDRRVARQADEAGHAMTVCQLFSDLPSHQDKIVAVRGIYYFSLLQPDCQSRLVVNGHEFPVALFLVGSGDEAGFKDRPVEFETDARGWWAFEDFAIKEGLHKRKEEIWVTVVGQLRGPVWHSRNGQTGVGGYGEQGLFAAELVIKSVSNVEVRPNPTFDYFRLVPKAWGGPSHR